MSIFSLERRPCDIDGNAFQRASTEDLLSFSCVRLLQDATVQTDAIKSEVRHPVDSVGPRENDTKEKYVHRSDLTPNSPEAKLLAKYCEFVGLFGSHVKCSSDLPAQPSSTRRRRQRT